jgi:hypothetical protein
MSSRSTPHALLIQRTGNRLDFRDDALDQRERILLDLMNLVSEIGVDRVRRSALEDCGRWLIARGRQVVCSPEHARLRSYRAWKDRGMPRGTKGGRFRQAKGPADTRPRPQLSRSSGSGSPARVQ